MNIPHHVCHYNMPFQKIEFNSTLCNVAATKTLRNMLFASNITLTKHPLILFDDKIASASCLKNNLVYQRRLARLPMRNPLRIAVRQNATFIYPMV